MIKETYDVIGVMSGTSLDGIDLVYVNFKYQQSWSFKITFFETIPYNAEWKHILSNLINYEKEELNEIDKKYTVFLSDVIKKFISKNGINIIDVISSHGHTALHSPDEGYTYQIGNLPVLAENLGIKVVCDFRVQDVALGGQGAPLVPIGDKLLFFKYDFCLNLGGFANISTFIDSDYIAYDICPVNIVLNYYTRQLGLDYDNKGSLASAGKINKELLDSLNNLDFYHLSFPKSLGIEWVKSFIFPLLDSFKLTVNDVLCTFCEHIAIQISESINSKKNASVLVTGGGAYNDYLIDRMKYHTKNDIILPDTTTIEFKEALIFALLGVLKLRNEINCLKTVTGANKNHSSGVVYEPEI
ncbi:anhydro-N-acetylmuramic acid kinase [Hyunsoonleella pacifica]|uniref:Anhydro-N-acetylmuramic acid kinase n=1 Tax=Hyunsoonleella pacifica TaxID=1080224 RepID=A0A4Q9FIE5_9FLAO|nr:anhydro-N-acetylmuramic acid kinase [Hyunsoonleella pacifica]TBN12494.1 anhydro-N-acetylmuramic acid kinase [Hyunsoonleella pacifica]GGD29044.1 anhydro-N-acetylmuramic acid kinase [Hyunsoonleella pacifica]